MPILAVAVAVFAACCRWRCWGCERIEGPAALAAGQVAIPLLTLMLAVLVGMEFPLAAKVDFQVRPPTSARLYTADYLGAALGALLVSTLLIPVLGVFRGMPFDRRLESVGRRDHAGKKG